MDAVDVVDASELGILQSRSKADRTRHLES
jgi:hypothetical protein